MRSVENRAISTANRTIWQNNESFMSLRNSAISQPRRLHIGGRDLPVAMHGKKYEVRTFMPNSRQRQRTPHQLHEVIRPAESTFLSKTPITLLIIKSGFYAPSRIQVYFIDNDDYFQKLEDDVENVGTNRPDNDERVIFPAVPSTPRASSDGSRTFCTHQDGSRHWCRCMRKGLSDGVSSTYQNSLFSA